MFAHTSHLRRALPKWLLRLRPGSGVKRWISATLVGLFLTGLGLSLLLFVLIAESPFHYLLLDFLPSWLRASLLIVLGLILGGLGIARLRSILQQDVWLELRTPEGQAMLRAFIKRQQRRQGPRVVAIGGGTGMPQLLRGLREYTDNITAIVTVADDGGSSGRLRRQTGALPPGDFRNNIAALSDAEGLMKSLFQYRFPETNGKDEDEQRSDLAGHSFGNLFIMTMAAITGSFEAAIAESSRVLAVRGRILPSTLENVTLCAEVRRTNEDGHIEWVTVQGESNLPKSSGQIERVYLQPAHARAYPEAIRAILQADLIVAGPGSFYTSVLPNLLVEAIRNAILASSAVRIYICNVATQPGETDGYTVLDHLRKLREHVGDLFLIALANDNYTLQAQPSPSTKWVTIPPQSEWGDFQIFSGDVVDAEHPWRHDSRKLAARLMEIYAMLAARSHKV